MHEMTLLSQQEITKALTRLGELASEKGHQVELLAIGGAVMVLAYDARPATHDVDVLILSPKEARITRDLAMKLSAWRDDVDIEDARRLLQELAGTQDEIWQAVEPFLIPGQQLKAQYAFLDLWETTYGTD